MGGSPSKTRKLTVENDDPTSVIKVSEDVVDRIKGKQTVSQDYHQAPSWPFAGQQGSSVVPHSIYLHEPSLTTLQLRQANIAELKKNDEYWQKRIKQLEENQKKMNELLDSEYKKSYEEYKGQEPKMGMCEPPCLSTRQAVMECYKGNREAPMRCAKLVQAFQECVDIKRSAVVSNRG